MRRCIEPAPRHFVICTLALSSLEPRHRIGLDAERRVLKGAMACGADQVPFQLHTRWEAPIVRMEVRLLCEPKIGTGVVVLRRPPMHEAGAKIMTRAEIVSTLRPWVSLAL
jgi:hypothetical protein